MGFCNCFIFCCALFCVHYIFAIEREMVALLCLSSWCLVSVVWLFPSMPRVCLQFVIVVFPDHTHLLFTVLQGHCLCFISPIFWVVIRVVFVALHHTEKTADLYLFVTVISFFSLCSGKSYPSTRASISSPLFPDLMMSYNFYTKCLFWTNTLSQN